MEIASLAIIITIGALMAVGSVAGYLQLRQIHAAVNSNMTTALDEIKALHGRVAGLVEELHHNKKEER